MSKLFSAKQYRRMIRHERKAELLLKAKELLKGKKKKQAKYAALDNKFIENIINQLRQFIPKDDAGKIEYLTTTEIIARLRRFDDLCILKRNINKLIGSNLRKLGFEKVAKRRKEGPRKVYKIQINGVAL